MAGRANYAIGRLTLLPELARFYGIIIRMFVESGERHHLPHIHVYYQDTMAVYGIKPIECLAGSILPLYGRMTHRLIRLLYTTGMRVMARNLRSVLKLGEKNVLRLIHNRAYLWRGAAKPERGGFLIETHP